MDSLWLVHFWRKPKERVCWLQVIFPQESLILPILRPFPFFLMELLLLRWAMMLNQV